MTSKKPSGRTQQEQDKQGMEQGPSQHPGREGDGARDKICLLPERLTQDKAKHRTGLRGRAGYLRLGLNGTPGLMSRASHVRPDRDCKPH